MIRVCLVDDQTLVRQGVRSLLELADNIEVVAEAADGRQAVELIHFAVQEPQACSGHGPVFWEYLHRGPDGNLNGGHIGVKPALRKRQDHAQEYRAAERP